MTPLLRHPVTPSPRHPVTPSPRHPRRIVHQLELAALRGADAGVEDRLRLQVERRLERLVERLARLQVMDELFCQGVTADREWVALDGFGLAAFASHEAEGIAAVIDVVHNRTCGAIEQRARGDAVIDAAPRRF